MSLILTDSQKQELYNYYSKELETLEARRQEILALLNQLNTTQNTSNPAKNLDNSQENDPNYHVNWSWFSKINYVLSKAQKVMTNREIFEELIKYEPVMEDFEQTAISSISGTVNVKIGSFLQRIKLYEGSGYYIGLSDWFNSNGNLKDKYNPNIKNVK
jgi:hypothetical protein